MRTPEQLHNLKRVLELIFGLPEIMISDDMVENMPNHLQQRINDILYTWEIRIRTVENKQAVWTDIAPEPLGPKYSLFDISSKCWQWLEKYPKIDAIRISIHNSPNDKYYFLRTKN